MMRALPLVLSGGEFSEGILGSLCEGRSQRLLCGRSHDWAASFLSGLLIADEISSARRDGLDKGKAVIIGGLDLTSHYARVMSDFWGSTAVQWSRIPRPATLFLWRQRSISRRNNENCGTRARCGQSHRITALDRQRTGTRYQSHRAAGLQLAPSADAIDQVRCRDKEESLQTFSSEL